MPFCFSPWTNVDISPQGRISPCCKFQGSTPEYTTIDNYINSDFLNNIKQEFDAGTWPSGCDRCRIEEDNCIKSKRQLDFDRWSSEYKHYDIGSNQFITASIAFGNTCNLKCITCNPCSSSRWQSEYQHIYNKNIQPVKFYKKDFVQEFTQAASGIVHLDIPGGEPFLSGVTEQKALLQHYIQSDQAPDMTIHYTTNATVMPDPEWWQLWQHFKEVEIQLSIDGIGNRFEYIRYPGNWSQVESNVAEYVSKQNLVRLSVSHTVSAYNIYYLDEFFAWCYNQQLPRPWLGRVHNPAHMRPAVWTAPVRNIIADHLMSSQYHDVKVWGQMMQRSNDSKHFETFKTKLEQHDQFRSLDFRNTFPELAKYI